MTEVRVPVFPESISEGTIVSWHKKTGERIEEGDVLAEIETDKILMEVLSMTAGCMGEIKKHEGDNVISQEIIGRIIQVGTDELSENSDNSSDGQSKLHITHIPEYMIVNAPTFPESILEGRVVIWHKNLGDSVEEGELLVEIETDKVMIEVSAMQNGILTKKLKEKGDRVLSTEAVAEIGLGNAVSVASEVVELKSPEEQQVMNDHLSPAVRRTVKGNNIDVKKLKGTGKNGRISKRDITNIIVSEKQTSSAAIIEGMNSTNVGRPEKRVRMTRLRQTLAKRLVEVQHVNAILTTFNEVDMKPVMDLRKQYKDLFQKTHDAKLGFMSFFLKAATEALKIFPEVNASIDGIDFIYHGFFDIGVAVGSDRGLVVPVIRNVDQKSFAEIENEIIKKALKAREGKLLLEEMQGGTFTITNGGTYGSMLSTPIINAPQSAILGMHNIVDRPVVVNGEIVIRPIMYLALSYDHRIIDGSISVKFLKKIKQLIEDPSRILLEI